jgi:hypothetical protein
MHYTIFFIIIVYLIVVYEYESILVNNIYKITAQILCPLRQQHHRQDSVLSSVDSVSSSLFTVPSLQSLLAMR